MRLVEQAVIKVRQSIDDYKKHSSWHKEFDEVWGRLEVLVQSRVNCMECRLTSLTRSERSYPHGKDIQEWQDVNIVSRERTYKDLQRILGKLQPQMLSLKVQIVRQPRVKCRVRLHGCANEANQWTTKAGNTSSGNNDHTKRKTVFSRETTLANSAI